jgi:hypothetical protein
MSRARHEKERKRRSKGGVVAYTAGDSNVMKEPHERKRGGRVHHMHGEGEEAHERHDRKRKRGGRMMEHEHEHEKHRKRGGRVHHHRAKGGEVGANERPLSTAARTTKIKGEGPESFPSD